METNNYCIQVDLLLSIKATGEALGDTSGETSASPLLDIATALVTRSAWGSGWHYKVLLFVAYGHVQCLGHYAIQEYIPYIISYIASSRSLIMIPLCRKFTLDTNPISSSHHQVP